MIKRSIYVGNPSYISTHVQQLEIKNANTQLTNTIPIEDIGIVILDNPQITITQASIMQLLNNNAALITCNETHHPTGLLLNLDGNTLQSQKFKDQIQATQPLRKQLWKQTIEQKIHNQAKVLQQLGFQTAKLHRWQAEVKTGDSTANEAKAAVYYWSKIFSSHINNFTRDRYGAHPNNLLNYAYAILRATVARSLVGSGLLPTLGIHHRNQYNAYCLADDIMEPYRPIVDILVYTIFTENCDEELTPAIKKQLLQIPTLDCVIDGERSPLMIATQRTTASLAKCFNGALRKIAYPQIP